MKMTRVNEIVASMESFTKDRYYKNEVLPELFLLQKEIVEQTFNNVHASTADLKIWDVEKHLKQLNEDCGNVADKELEVFIKGSKDLCNLIKAEVSGNRGEAKAFRVLDNIQVECRIIKNVELKVGDIRTELDAVVITPGTVTIVEVKNTGRDIYIDEKGNYFRTGEFLKLDCNIAEKMDLKESLLRKAIKAEGDEDFRINRVVVFTNNRIEVQNKYSGIQTCFVTQLASVIENNSKVEEIKNLTMEQIESMVVAAEEKDAYPSKFDVEKYKREFAIVTAILEEASAKESDLKEEVVIERKSKLQNVTKRVGVPKRVRHMGGVAAAAMITLTTITIVDLIEKGVVR